MLSMIEKLGRVVNRSAATISKTLKSKNLQIAATHPVTTTASPFASALLSAPTLQSRALERSQTFSTKLFSTSNILQLTRNYSTHSNQQHRQAPPDLLPQHQQSYSDICQNFPSESEVFYKLLKLALQYNKNGASPFRNTLLVGMQHMLGTTVDMLKVMYALGLHEAVIGGKNYSNHQGSIERYKKLGSNFVFVESNRQLGYGGCNDTIAATVIEIWLLVMKKVKERSTPYDMIIVLDDGGDLLATINPQIFGEDTGANRNLIVGVEQTTNGLKRPGVSGLPYPIINFARTFIKKAEHTYVADVILNAISQQIKEKVVNAPSLTIGIVGYGTMGKAVEQAFLREGYRVVIYDRNKAVTAAAKQRRMNTCADLFNAADIIVGCTGEDITASRDVMEALENTSREKWLVSTSSKDYEFNSVLRNIQDTQKKAHKFPNPLQDISYVNQLGTPINVLNGGFPVNFNNQEHSVSPEHIWMTRAGLLLSCLECTNPLRKNQPDILRNSDQILQLDPKAQLMIIKERLKTHRTDELFLPFEKMSEEEAERHIALNSVGKSMPPIRESSSSPAVVVRPRQRVLSKTDTSHSSISKSESDCNSDFFNPRANNNKRRSASARSVHTTPAQDCSSPTRI